METPFWLASLIFGTVTLVYFTAERSLSFFSWSMFEELSVPRPRRVATEKCLEERELASLSLLVLGVISAAVFAVCASVREDGPSHPWPDALPAVGMVALLAWILPEVLARHFKARIVLYLVPPLYQWTGFPIRVLHRLFGRTATEPRAEASGATPEAGAETAATDDDAQEFMRLAVRLKHMPVREIMTPRTDMVSLHESATLRRAAEVGRETGFSRLPVYRGNRDDILGILHIKDLLALAGTDRWDKDSISALVRPPLFIPETKPISGLMEEFRRSSIHMGIVLDEYGGTSGLVTLEDVMEELVGEIHDEHEILEKEPPPFVWTGEKTVEVQAVMHVAEINEEFNLDLPEDEDFDTLGGFVMFSLGRIPETGESFEYGGAKFTVIEADPRRVLRVRVEFAEAPERTEPA